jgi:hypothetical protein
MSSNFLVVKYQYCLNCWILDAGLSNGLMDLGVAQVAR